MAAVRADIYGGAREAMRYLVSLGHRRIGFLGGVQPLSRARSARFRAYEDVLREFDIPVETALLVGGSPGLRDTAYTGYQGFCELRARRSDFTAVFAFNDLVAMGALAAAAHQGLTVPGDVSVVGFDDAPGAAYVSPPLTTVNVPRRRAGTEIMRLIKDMQDGAPPRGERLSTTLVVRSSTRYLPAATGSS